MRAAWGLAGVVSVALGSAMGCGVAPQAPCVLLNVLSPANATADHYAAAPGNTVQYSVSYAEPVGRNDCPIPALAYAPTLTSSDTVNVKVTGTGVATCVGTTTVPATLTDTRSGATAQLSCR